MSKRPDPLGDQIKELEMAEAGRKAIPGLPLLARLDGRAFHTYTRGLDRPYDARMTTCMIETVKSLVEEFHPRVGYTQSDEITLAWYIPPDNNLAQLPFDGRFQKLTSVLAAHASVVFSRHADVLLPEKSSLIPTFDCRVWQMPSLQKAIDVFAWREADAVKNSVTMAASAFYSHKELDKKGSREKHDMLHAKGINWNNYPASFKRGTYVKRITSERELTEQEWLAIPEAHRPPRDQKFLRSQVGVLELEPILRVPNIMDIFFPSRTE